jgi:hypothetical protein
MWFAGDAVAVAVHAFSITGLARVERSNSSRASFSAAAIVS